MPETSARSQSPSERHEPARPVVARNPGHGSAERAELGTLQRTAGNRATAALLRGGINGATASTLEPLVTAPLGPTLQRAPIVQRSWIGDRIGWVRNGTRDGNWETEDPPGAYHVLNGLSMDDMVRVLRALTSAERAKLAANLEENGGRSDRSRIHLAITNASTSTADPAFRELSENLHWAIRSGNFTSPPNGAFNILAAATAAQQSRLAAALNRDALDALIDRRDEAAAVPGAPGALTVIERRRGTLGSTSREQRLTDLIDGGAWAQFFAEFNGMQEFDQLRFLRGHSGAIPPIRDNIRRADGIGDPVRILYLLERATTPALRALYVDAMVSRYSWQPKYRVAHPADLSNIIRFSDLADVELDISTIGDNQMGAQEADRQFREAVPGPGGFLWPEVRNRSTLPVLWQVKQLVREQQWTLLGDEVLQQGIFVVQYLMDVVLPVAHTSAIQSLGALRGASLSGRWMQGSQVVRGKTAGGTVPPAPPTAPRTPTIWGQGNAIQGRGAEAALKSVTPGTHFYGNFDRFDRAVYSSRGPSAPALEVGQLKSIDTARKSYQGAGLNRVIENAAGDIAGVGESTWEKGGHTMTIGPQTRRVVDVAIPDTPLTAAQEAAIAEAVAGSASMGVEVRIYRVP
ncbi:hypothetical protein [Frankia sp. Cas4]|uniref:hypothetical protein n=1 Tax=Frankia sp. Cas4 TaxID=3073927 RepID=UPI002AD22640|nr:hypothetical protein [Frankia sp. Cas4]